MNVYIAAPYELLGEAAGVSQRVAIAGHTVTSWWIATETKMTENTFELNNHFAHMDLDDIQDADVFILLNPPGWENKGTGGRHWETGAAFILGKRMIIIGVRSNIFHWFQYFHIVDNVDQAMLTLESFI